MVFFVSQKWFIVQAIIRSILRHVAILYLTIYLLHMWPSCFNRLDSKTEYPNFSCNTLQHAVIFSYTANIIDVSFNCSVEFSVILYTSFPNGAQNSKSLRHRSLLTWAPDKLRNELWVNSYSRLTSFCASETLTNSWDIFVVCSRSWIITFKSASQVNNSTKPSRWTQRSKEYCF